MPAPPPNKHDEPASPPHANDEPASWLDGNDEPTSLPDDNDEPASWLDDPYVAAHPENRPFWEAAEQGRFLGKRCDSCDRVHWYPRTICPFCGSLRTHWTPLSGRGHVYAFSTLRRAKPPYIVAYVQLDEGPMVLTNLVELGATQPEIGMHVGVVFRRTDHGRRAPKFTIGKPPLS